MKLSSLEKEKFIVLIKETNNFFMNNDWNKIENFVKLMKSLNEMEELKRFQGSTFDAISRRRLVEHRDTILELTAKTQELHNER